ncbi:MAG: flippase-like domain-containing protein [Desulfobacterales bacterium]|nr:flippase-like domain-containing protein [Desulfobacterales bacterium]
MIKNNMKRYMLLLRFGVALFLLLFLVVSSGIENLADTFVSVRPVTGIAVGCCLSFLFLLGAINVWLLLRTIYSIPLYDFLKVYSYCWAMSLITPGQIGDASLVLFLKKRGIAFRHTGIVYLTDKVITLIMFSGIAWYGSYILIPELKGIWLPVFVSCLSIALFFFALIKFFPLHTQFAKNWRQRLNQIFDEINIFREKWYLLIINFLITIVKWLVVSLCYFLGFISFNVYVKWPEVAVIPILSTLVGYIPVSIAGIGTVEISAIYLFSRVGVEQPCVLSVYLFMRSLQYLLAILMLGLSWQSKSDWRHPQNPL